MLVQKYLFQYIIHNVSTSSQFLLTYRDKLDSCQGGYPVRVQFSVRTSITYENDEEPTAVYSDIPISAKPIRPIES